ncbi:hypothetical protein [Halorussus caseinilyticus]|uniref:Peptidase M48 domain-containing protein n=1 Tax=Halorussus caseinilyticus TaxID=3034025 RepID=A0ABD5WE38_9EURY|nr:hypothetical protein [Halorussus sp. DT72]
MACHASSTEGGAGSSGSDSDARVRFRRSSSLPPRPKLGRPTLPTLEKMPAPAPRPASARGTAAAVAASPCALIRRALAVPRPAAARTVDALRPTSLVRLAASSSSRGPTPTPAGWLPKPLAGLPVEVDTHPPTDERVARLRDIAAAGREGYR